MTHPNLALFGYSEAAMFARRATSNVTALISIHGSREFGIELDVEHRLDLFFDDVEAPATGDVMALQRAMSRRIAAERNGLTEVPPVAADAAAIIRFAKQVRQLSGTLLCHCGGGISRAPAAALICLTVWRGVGSEAASTADVLSLRPAAVPHEGLIRFADDALRRQGALVHAVAAARRRG